MSAFRLNFAGWVCQVTGTLFLLMDSIRVGIRLPRGGVTLGDPPLLDTWYYRWASPVGFLLLFVGFGLCGVALRRLRADGQSLRGSEAPGSRTVPAGGDERRDGRLEGQDRGRAPTSVSDRDLYREIIRHWMHHSRWREKLFTGYLIVLGALAIAYYAASSDNSRVAHLLWVVPATGVFVAVIFILIDYRIEEVLHALAQQGSDLEPRPAVFGDRPPTVLSHRWLLRSVYAVTGLALVALLFYDLCRR